MTGSIMPAPRSLLSREAQLLLLTAGGPSNDAPLRQLLASELDETCEKIAAVSA